MTTKCWNGQREQRWDIRPVYDQLSVASVQERAEGERGNNDPCQTAVHAGKAAPFSELQTRGPVLNVVEDSPITPPPNPRTHLRQSPVGDRLSIFVEGNLDVYPKPSLAHRRYYRVEPGHSDCPIPPTHPRAKGKSVKCGGNMRSQTAPRPSAPHKNLFTFPFQKRGR